MEDSILEPGAPAAALPADEAPPAHGWLRRFVALRAPLYANAYALLANQVSSAALGFLYWLLAARLYPVDVVGRSSAAISTLLLIAGVSQLGLTGGMVRFVPRAGRHTCRLIGTAYVVVPAAAAILSVTFLVVSARLGFLDKLTGGALPPAVFVMATVLWTVFYFQDGILNGLRRSVWVLVENLLYNVAKIALLVLGVRLLGKAGILASWFLPTPLTIVLVVWLVFGRFLRMPAEEPASGSPPLTLREVVSSVTGDHIGSVISEVSVRLLPLLVIALLGAAENAYFYQAWLVATTLSLAAIGMTASYTAQAAADRDNIARHSRDILRHLLLLIAPVALLIAAFAPLVLAVFGPRYVVAAPLLRLLALAAPIVAFNIWYLAYIRVRGRIGRVIVLQAITAVILLALGYAGLRTIGILGIGVAWLVGQGVVAAIGLADAWEMLRQGVRAAAPAAEASAVMPTIAVTAEGEGLVRAPVSASRRALFVSPHLDDAVLSCGGAIRRLTAEGWDVTVVTVCTADPAPGSYRSPFAQRVETEWALGETPFAVRRAEDEDALRLLGATPRYLEMLDVVYRTGDDAQPLYPRPVNVALHPDDADAFVESLLPRLEQVTRELDGPVFCPGGIGGHVDHLLVKRAVERLCDQSRIIYYEEYPYLSPERLDAPATPDGSDVALWVLPLTAEEVEARVQAVARYRSQLRGLFPTTAERAREILSARLPLVGPLFSVPDRRPPLERVRGRVLPDVAACGGERYWSVPPAPWPFA